MISSSTEQQERHAIEWVEGLSPEEGEVVLRQALEEWDEMVSQCHDT